MARNFFLILVLISSALVDAQTPFNISLKPIVIDSLGGNQSYAFGQHNGKWLIIGGRLDGLHRRQPFASFDEAGHNNRLLVIDPISKKHWSADLSSLETDHREHLSSTNMEFYQEGDKLICIGGYGISSTEEDHITFPYLAAIDVPGIIDAIINEKDIQPFIEHHKNEIFRVTGGKLRKIDDQYYLIGGQKFMGRYNPMGAEFGPGFVQEYLNGYRVFDFNVSGKHFSYQYLKNEVDTVLMHKRDYNAESAILPNGEQSIIMYSGVFQYDRDLPWQNAVMVTEDSFYPVEFFQQYYNHYHCPVIPLYSGVNKENHTLFLGGIAEFFYQDGLPTQDNNVPFVSTISRVTIDRRANMKEYKMATEMPAYFGAAAEFIPEQDLPRFSNNVINLDALQGDSILLGYIYGGIKSSGANIFFQNEGDLSEATSTIFAVYLKKDVIKEDDFNEASFSYLSPTIFADEMKGKLEISFNSPGGSTNVTVYDIDNSKRIMKRKIKSRSAERVKLKKRVFQMWKGTTYLITIESLEDKIEQRLFIEY